MAATAILGVYASKSALDSAHSSGNTKGDTYIVGSGIPYDLYSWSGSAFVKGDLFAFARIFDRCEKFILTGF